MKQHRSGVGNEIEGARQLRVGRSAESEGLAPVKEFDGSPVLVCQGYGVSFGARVVLAEVDLVVPSRGTTVLMGPAGTGKSTLLRALAGFLANNQLHKCWGTTLYRGDALTSKNRPALVTQRIELTQRSVRDSLLFHVRRDWSSACSDIEERLSAWLEYVGAPQFIERFDQCFLDLQPDAQRMVGILREAAAAPSLLMIDEPTSNLSDDDAPPVLDLAQRLARDMAVLMILHNQKQVRRVADQVILLAGGRVQEQSQTSEFFQSQNHVVRQFVLTGSCALPAPDAPPESLAAKVAPPPPLPENALAAIRGDAQTRTGLALTENEASAAGWLGALPLKVRQGANGPPGFAWIVEGWLAGVSRPGSVNDIDYDLDLLKGVGLSTLVTLTETDLPQSALQRHSLSNIHMPIPDGQAPSIEKAASLTHRMRALLLEESKAIAVHCLQGAGRTGTILACCLIEGSRLTAREAVTRLRAINPEFVKTREQEAFLDAYEKSLRQQK